VSLPRKKTIDPDARFQGNRRALSTRSSCRCLRHRRPARLSSQDTASSFFNGLYLIPDTSLIMACEEHISAGWQVSALLARSMGGFPATVFTPTPHVRPYNEDGQDTTCPRAHLRPDSQASSLRLSEGNLQGERLPATRWNGNGVPLGYEGSLGRNTYRGLPAFAQVDSSLSKNATLALVPATRRVTCSIRVDMYNLQPRVNVQVGTRT